MQVVVQVNLFGFVEEYLGQVFQFGGMEGFVVVVFFVVIVEQVVYVLFDVVFVVVDGFGVVEQEEDFGGRFEGVCGDFVDQLFEQFDGCGFVVVDIG